MAWLGLLFGYLLMRNRQTIDPVASMLVCEAIWESKRMEINAQ
jgi:hypothetical protein